SCCRLSCITSSSASLHLPLLHSFPTRRSSDLQGGLRRELAAGDRIRQEHCGERLRDRADLELVVLARVPAGEKDRAVGLDRGRRDRKSTRLNSSHVSISYAVFCLKKKSNMEDT